MWKADHDFLHTVEMQAVNAKFPIGECRWSGTLAVLEAVTERVDGCCVSGN